MSSSVTDSKAAAVVTKGDEDPPRATAQRARTMGPTCGTVAPAGTAAISSAHTGACARASVTTTVMATACSTTPGSRTTRCP